MSRRNPQPSPADKATRPLRCSVVLVDSTRHVELDLITPTVVLGASLITYGGVCIPRPSRRRAESAIMRPEAFLFGRGLIYPPPVGSTMA